MVSTVINKKVNKERITNHSPKYNVILFNDDVNDMNHVMMSLITIVGISEQSAYSIMMQAHSAGKALVITCELEHAEHYKAQLINKGLRVSIEQV